MIARIWRGVVGRDDAKVYGAYIGETGLAGYRDEDDRYLIERDDTVKHYEVTEG